MLGRAKRVTIDKDNTTIVDGAGKKSDIEGPLHQIRKPGRGHHLRLRPREAAGASWPS
jgi:chaperonin GroEL (HSP60 family)